MALDPKSTLIRACSGAVYVIIIISACLIGKYGVLVLSALLGILGILEYRRLHFPHFKSSVGLVAYDCLGILLLLGSVFIYPFIAWILWFLGRMIITIFSKNSEAGEEFICDLAGQVYIGLPLALMSVMGFLFDTCIDILFFFIIIWVNDTGAFLFGSTLGRHRLFERISPKKSWEGFWGGLACSIAAGFAIAALSDISGLPFRGENFWPGNLKFWLPASIIISVFSTLGDLFESFIKRTHHVKDSGHLIPGHGGILDRIDSLLMVIPALAVFIAFLYLA